MRKALSWSRHRSARRKNAGLSGPHCAKNFYACMIAGTHSGAGKTTWSLALMALARKKGLAVQPFKAGPDYIDAGFHHAVCAPRKSRNLDLFLLSEDYVRKSFRKNSADADWAMAEGVMGLFDGRTAVSEEGSSAELAKCLGLPVLLVLDGSKLASSAAAVVLGFQKIDPAVKLAGVLINRVNHEGHFKWLKEAIESKTGAPCLGYLPDDPEFLIPERHLGLTTALETPQVVSKIEKAVVFLEGHFNWECFEQVCRQGGWQGKQGSQPCETSLEHGWDVSPDRPRPATRSVCRMGAAYDPAFSFYYEDNFDLMREAGAEIVFFSPLGDAKIPENLDLLYFGGGFPEMHAARLSQNTAMIQAIRSFYKSGGFIYAECGGFIYLTEAFSGSKGQRFPLVGLIPGTIRMTGRLQNFGYHDLTALCDTFLFPKGTALRSHEFHYSVWESDSKGPAVYEINGRTEGFYSERLVASYQHLHFGSRPDLVRNLIQSCQKRRNVYV